MAKSIEQKPRKDGSLFETVKTIIYAVLIALIIRSFAFEPFNIPSGSMIPNLLIGDYLFVSKYSYGYSRHSLPMSPPIFSGRVFKEKPERGDVAVFKLPKDNETDYIKRVIGLPGDTVQLINGRLLLNGKLVPRKRIENFIDLDLGRSWPQYIETLPNGSQHKVIEQLGDFSPLDNTLVYKVPSGHYFMMGDNRDNSADSRVQAGADRVGYVPLDNFVGRAEVLFFSTNGSARLWEIWQWIPAMRLQRFFKVIE